MKKIKSYWSKISGKFFHSPEEGLCSSFQGHHVRRELIVEQGLPQENQPRGELFTPVYQSPWKLGQPPLDQSHFSCKMSLSDK